MARSDLNTFIRMVSYDLDTSAGEARDIHKAYSAAVRKCILLGLPIKFPGLGEIRVHFLPPGTLKTRNFKDGTTITDGGRIRTTFHLFKTRGLSEGRRLYQNSPLRKHFKEMTNDKVKDVD